MNNLLSYCGLVDAKIRTSNKDLPVPRKKKERKRNAARKTAKPKTSKSKTALINLSSRGVARGGAEGARVPPEFGRSVNPI